MDASKGKQIVMFLDYDGTLSPIVDDPDRAFMSNSVSLFCFQVPIASFIFLAAKIFCLFGHQMRKTVRKLARCFPTAIVTGRCKDKVRFLIPWSWFPYPLLCTSPLSFLIFLSYLCTLIGIAVENNRYTILFGWQSYIMLGATEWILKDQREAPNTTEWVS